jgi:hypothetical protein
MSNYYNHPDRLPQIKRGKSGGAKFHLSWFENVVKRVEHIKPVAVGQDNNTQTGTPLIKVTDRPNGDGREITLNVATASLNVCSNGVPDSIVILVAPATET